MLLEEDRVRAVVVWALGTLYVLATLAGMAAIVWAADNRDNSANPTHWLVTAVVVLAPTALPLIRSESNATPL